MKRFVVSAAVVALVVSALWADWPCFQGPNRDGIAVGETKLAKTWPAEGPPVLWRFALGEGFGGPAISGTQVFLLDRQGASDVLRCIGLADGKEAWNYTYDAPGKPPQHNGSRSTPSVDDKYVFTIGLFGHFNCVARADHKAVWSKNLLTDFGAKLPQWAVSQSPLLYKDWVIVAPCGPSVGVIAFEKSTGKEVWKTEAIGALQYNSPYVTKIDGVEQVIMYGGSKNLTVAGFDVKNGATLWKYTGWSCSIPIACPTAIGDGRFFLTGGYGAGSQMIKVEHQGDSWTVTKLWSLGSKECGSQIHDALLWKDCLYVDNNENGKSLGMVCVDLDGKVKWQSNDPKMEKGGQLIADGMIYKLDGTLGWLYLIDPSPEGCKLLAKAKVLNNKGELWAPPAISGGKLIVRDQKEMACVDVSAK